MSTEDRIGPWISTYMGKRFYPMDPRPEEVDILDIAQSSALTTRYRGHVQEFYSVAQHQMTLASYILMCFGDAEAAMKAALHDAGETYTADIPGQMKPLCYLDLSEDPAFPDSLEAVESRILAVVFDSLGMTPEIPEMVHDADLRIRYDEAQALRVNQELYHDPGRDPLGVVIKPCWPPNDGRRMFMKYFGYLSELVVQQRVTKRVIPPHQRRPALHVIMDLDLNA